MIKINILYLLGRIIDNEVLAERLNSLKTEDSIARNNKKAQKIIGIRVRLRGGT